MEQQTDFIKLFNSGFKIRRYYPELYEKLRGSLSEDNEMDKAVLEGAKQAELEMNKQLEKEQNRLNELNGENFIKERINNSIERDR